jgi:hypothetical protein
MEYDYDKLTNTSNSPIISLLFTDSFKYGLDSMSM